MKTLRATLTWVLVFAIGFGGAGCTSTKRIRPTTAPDKPVYGSVKPGDKVTLQMTDGRRMKIRVSQLDDEGVVSAEGVRYLRNDIRHVERQSFSPVKTIALVAGVGVGVLLVAGLMIVSALDDPWY